MVNKMKINWLEYDNKDHVLAWFLVEAMSKTGIDNFGNFDSSALDVELTINGVQVSFIETMEFLQTQLDKIYNDGKKDGAQILIDKINTNVQALLEDLEV